MTELKPCPFCGGEAVVDKYPVRGYEPAVSFEVRCSICGQKRVGGYFDTVDKSEKWARRKAIEAWNNRPNPWHTGTPTEGGLYFVYDKYCGYGKRELKADISEEQLEFAFHNVVAWQKIEERQDGRTD